MSQDSIFSEREGNRWFERNRMALETNDKTDWPSHLIKLLENKSGLQSVVELGCSNGYRLNRIRKDLANNCRCIGVDASHEAIDDGKQRYPDLELHQGVLTAVPLQDEFDLVIVNFVLHWVDRRTLVKSLSEIDRLTKDRGLLVFGDFLPDYQQRRRYHHLPNDNVYTYKQDYARIFEAFGTYRELSRVTFHHDNKQEGYTIQAADSSARAYCAVLHKTLEGFYPEV